MNRLIRREDLCELLAVLWTRVGQGSIGMMLLEEQRPVPDSKLPFKPSRCSGCVLFFQFLDLSLQLLGNMLIARRVLSCFWPLLSPDLHFVERVCVRLHNNLGG